MIITVSREAATNGGLIGRLVAERLGLRVYDRELVDEIARRMQVDRNVITPFDEGTLGPVQSVLWEWRTSVNEQVYARYLRQAMRRVYEEGNSVVIGRGANFVLRCTGCLHVRIVAPMALRTAIYRSFYDVSESEARWRIRAEDRDKARFVRSVYKADITDPANYDMVINLGGLAPDTVVELIIDAARARVEQRLPAEPRSTFAQHVEIMSRHRRPTRPGIVERNREVG